MRDRLARPAPRALTSTLAAVAALAFAWPARAALPHYLQPGFPLETLDPAPAGDRFAVTPDAAIVPSPVTVRAVVDYSSNRQSYALNGGTLEEPSASWYGHFGLSTAPWSWLLVSADVPVVLDQTATIRTAEPGAPYLTPDPLGDLRAGARLRLTPPSLGHFAIATSADVWLRTGTASDLTGEPADRFRAMLLASGDFACGRLVFDLAGAAGYQTFTETVSTYGSARGVPLRAALGVEHALIGGVRLRGALEYFGTAWAEPVGTIDRNAGEGLLDLFLVFPQTFTLGVSEGLGFVRPPGVPGARVILSLQYRTPMPDPAAKAAGE